MKTRPWADILTFMELPGDPAARVCVLPFGVFDYWDEQLEITRTDGEQLVANFAAGVYGQRVPIEVSDHMPTGQGAAGWYTELRVEDDRVTGTVEWNSLGQSLIADRRFMYHSPEVYLRSLKRTYLRPTDKAQFTNLLIGDSLTNHPFFKTNEVSAFSEAAAHQPLIFRVPVLGTTQPEETTMATETPAEGSAPTVDAAQFAELKSRLDAAETHAKALQAKSDAADAALATERTKRERVELAAHFAELKFAGGIIPPAIAESAAELALRFGADKPEGAEKSDRDIFCEFVAGFKLMPVGTVGFGESESDQGVTDRASAEKRIIELSEGLANEQKISFTEALVRVRRDNPELAKTARG